MSSTKPPCFPQLNKAWQEGINKQINDVDGDNRPEIATAFRAMYARHLLECLIARTPSKADLDEIQRSYIDFTEGWDAAMNKLAKDQPGLIASWVRAHGEYTDYSDLEGPEYPAYIVKEADLGE
jgi:hypothetical protein